MNANEVTKEDVNEWTDAEVILWFNKFSEDEQAEQMRQHMLSQIEIRDASGCRILSIESEVVDHS